MQTEKNTKRKKNSTTFTSGPEAAISGRKGGVASGKARRRKRDVRFAILALLDGVENGQSGTERLAAALWDKAMQGDTKAIAVLVSWANAAHAIEEREELGIEDF